MTLCGLCPVARLRPHCSCLRNNIQLQSTVTNVLLTNAVVMMLLLAAGCGALQCMRPSQPEVAGYENLLRNIMLRAPEAALISLGVFNWRTDTFKGVEIPNAYYSTGKRNGHKSGCSSSSSSRAAGCLGRFDCCNQETAAAGRQHVNSAAAECCAVIVICAGTCWHLLSLRSSAVQFFALLLP
jgi:hypothetical protein